MSEADRLDRDDSASQGEYYLEKGDTHRSITMIILNKLQETRIRQVIGPILEGQKEPEQISTIQGGWSSTPITSISPEDRQWRRKS